MKSRAEKLGPAAKKHVYREYITIKSRPMAYCYWKLTLFLLIRIEETSLKILFINVPMKIFVAFAVNSTEHIIWRAKSEIVGKILFKS